MKTSALIKKKEGERTNVVNLNMAKTAKKLHKLNELGMDRKEAEAKVIEVMNEKPREGPRRSSRIAKKAVPVKINRKKL